MFGKQSVGLALVINKDEKRVLGVSRKDDITKMGLPGGKCEDNETSEEGTIREVKEETGLDVEIISLVFQAIDNEYFSTTFLCEIKGEIPKKFNTTETGRVDWITWEELFDGPFGEYNKKLYTTLYPIAKWKNLVNAESVLGYWDFTNIIDSPLVEITRFNENDEIVSNWKMNEEEFKDLADLILRLSSYKHPDLGCLNCMKKNS